MRSYEILAQHTILPPQTKQGLNGLSAATYYGNINRNYEFHFKFHGLLQNYASPTALSPIANQIEWMIVSDATNAGANAYAPVMFNATTDLLFEDCEA